MYNCYDIVIYSDVMYLSRMPAPKLPTWQDCHELWSKKRRRQQREQESLQKPSGGLDGTGPN